MRLNASTLQKNLKALVLSFAFLMSYQIASANLVFHGQLCTEPNSDMVQLNITTEGFDNLFSFQFTFNWDMNVLEYNSLGDYSLPHFSNQNYGTMFTEEGHLNFSWNDGDGIGETLEDGSHVFTIYFKKLTDDDPQFSMDGSLTPVEVISGDFNEIDMNFSFNSEPCSFNSNPTTKTDNTPIRNLSAQVRPNILQPNETPTLTIEGTETTELEISIFNLEGTLLNTQKINHQTERSEILLSTPETSGLYFIRILDELGGVKTLKLAVQ